MTDQLVLSQSFAGGAGGTNHTIPKVSSLSFAQKVYQMLLFIWVIFTSEKAPKHYRVNFYFYFFLETLIRV